MQRNYVYANEKNIFRGEGEKWLSVKEETFVSALINEVDNLLVEKNNSKKEVLI